jgi:tetratricopeptide (TPR) repeat protein
MSDRIKCPKCREQALTDTHYSLIRDELILFDGKCVNCGYEITAETLYEQLRNKFDLEKDFEHLEKPLDYILTKLKSTEEEPRKNILSLFAKVYGEKLSKATDDGEIEKYLNQFIYYKQLLEGITYSKEQIYAEFAGAFMNKDKFRQAAGYWEKALALYPTDSVVSAVFHMNLSLCYAYMGEYNKGVNLLELVCRRAPPDFPLTPFCHALKIAYLMENGQYKEATEFGKALTLPSELLGLDPVVHSFLLRAFVKIGDLENALAEFDNLVASEPDHFTRLDFSFFVNNALGFEEFCSAVFTLLRKDTKKAYALVREIDIDQLKEDCNEEDSVEYAALVIFVSFLKATVYCDYFFAGGKKENQLLKDTKKYLGISIDTWRVWQVGGDLGFDSWPPRETWEVHFGSVDRIQPEAHILMGKIYETFGDSENAFVEYKKAAEYEDYGSNEVLLQKIEETKLKLGGFADKLLEKVFAPPQSAISETEQDTQNRISAVLLSIQETFPDIAEDFRKLVATHGFDKSIILTRARLIIEKFLHEIEGKSEELKITDTSVSEKGRRKPSFGERVRRLKDAGAFDKYIQSLMIMIYTIGSKGAHLYEDSNIALELEDVELTVLALQRFLSWYSKKYLLKKE